MCDGKKHKLIEILRTGNDIETVVRWCKDCGAIVVDGELDGRVAPGRVMPMRFPNNINELSFVEKEI